MNTRDNAAHAQQLVIEDFEFVIVWIAGALFALWGGLSLAFFPPKILVLQLIDPMTLVSGLVMLMLYPRLKVVADRSTRTLRLEYRYLLFRRTRKIPFDEIAAIRAEYSRSTDSDGHSSSGYRLVAELIDGRIVPFRTSFGGADPKDATRLQGFIRRTNAHGERPEA
jgi:hypothetical protein